LSRNVPAERNGKRDKSVEGAAGNTHRHPGKSRGIELEAAEAVEQALLAPGVVIACR
jgi:hypothetical protein